MSNINSFGHKYREKPNGVPVLSKDEIDSYAELVVQDYKPDLLKTPQAIPVEEMIELSRKLTVDYQNLSPDRTILGMTTFGNGFVEVFDDDNKKQLLSVSEGTIIVDNALLCDDQRGRCRFTFGHELGHWVFHRHMYLKKLVQMSLMDLVDGPHQAFVKCHKKNVGKISRRMGGFHNDEDWTEWQADYFSSALLMPRKIFKEAANETMGQLGLGQDQLPGNPYPMSSLVAGMLASHLSQAFDVSMQAASVRLYKFGYIEETVLSQALSG